MDFNNISLCADPTNCFSTGPQPTESGQDIASGQANFGPFSVGISPARAPIHLSQAAGAATDYAREYRDLISKNIAAISSDEAVCHLKLPHALPANTSGIFDQSKKKRLKPPEKPDELFERLTGFKDFFRKDSKDTEGKKVDFPSGADISPHHASISYSR
ncbi:hypothetical protein [Endozoicomonas sp. ALB115]|uniref:hypothetical protein n=1 Tax=Endozoicomonas sp. ALB115 TaxID=3403074 RepID=UPI003BB7419D